ncbi:Ribonuclease H domain containing protein [Parasponia andersonii]|uniref:Ribonuclease H domain containing protein n=1 Tax=Parasponia andersonii TaxID=3476 RepID=A0A2P5DHM3_PARAD|nr:Ribonuclease H domain containing protein [Parasponia andersonii]
MADQSFNLLHTLEPRRDSYGFALRPQHAQRYRQYANIYKEEEEERSDRWKDFLEQLVGHAQPCSSEKEHKHALQTEAADQKVEINSERLGEGEDTSNKKSITDGSSESDKETKASKVQTWAQIRSSLDVIENMMSSRVKKNQNIKDELITIGEKNLQSIEKTGSLKASEEFEEEVCINGMLSDIVKASTAENAEDGIYESKNSSGSEVIFGNGVSRNENSAMEEIAMDDGVSYSVNAGERKKPVNDGISVSVDTNGAENAVSDGFYGSVNYIGAEKPVEDGFSFDPFFPWKEELESLVRGGVPKDLRGEVWQAFVGVKAHRVERYYHDLLAQERNTDKNKESDDLSTAASKWKRQIEKDIPRTFPGHPALDENGRNSLRRLLLAYAQHNPSVGYCQAMNFFAGLLLLLMPEENAFWALVGILDDYFEGYYTEEMIESQVDQLVFEELMRDRFPKLVDHLDYLGVQVAWISGPWFLSIFVNTLPWESVLRVWDVLLYEGNRVMLFRTALALMELYGPALVTTKDAGDATTLSQSLAGSTFDSSQLVLTACMGFLAVTEARLEELREKHRPAVLVVVEERSKKGSIWKDSKGLATKLYSFKHDPVSLIEEKKTSKGGEMLAKGDKSHLERHSSNLDDLLDRLAVDPEVDSLPDLQEQVVWLKVELCRLLEEKRSAVLRAEELETALMEMVKQDNRRQLSARVEQLEQEVAHLQQALTDKKEQESAMLKVLMRVEQEQKVTEDARICAEQDAAAQKYAVHVLQEKYEKAVGSLVEMEKRVVMAESMLEATLQYQTGQVKAHCSPRALPNQGSTQESTRKSLLPFGLGWRDRNKSKPASAEESSVSKSTNEPIDASTPQKRTSEQE